MAVLQYFSTGQAVMLNAYTMRTRLAPAFLGVLATFLFAYPFAWMFFSSFKTNNEIYQPLLFFPSEYESDAYVSLLSGELPSGASLPFSFLEVFSHSILASGSQALLATALTAMAGYAFAKYRFRWKNVLFALAILVILVPRQALAVPLFEWLTQLRLNGSLWAIILPGAASGIGVIFFTQVFRRIPNSLMDLAQIEGASETRTLLLLLPLVAPALVTYGLIHFVLSWQEHLFPLLLLSDDNQVLPLALAKLRDSSHRIPEAVSMAAATCSLLPVAILFAIFHRQIRTALRDFTAH
ncbi:MAG: hypothetical protein CMI31_03060 [Opitutae bacterium]|nr:hypothetical protein [Opitutae bacterium]